MTIEYLVFALLVTLIVLLILAGISLNGLFIGEGIFKRTKDASSDYNEAKAREVLETVLLTDGQYEKNTNPKYNQDDFLDELIKKEIPGSNVIEDVAIIGGEYAYELDRSVPKIGHYLGNPKDLIWPKVTTTEPVLADDYRSASFTITATIEEKATKGITRIEVWLLGEIIKEYKYTDNTKDTRTETFETNRNGEYTIKAYADLKGSTQTTVEGIVPAVEFMPNGNTEWKKEHSTKIIVKETAEKVKSLKYKWTNSAKAPAETEFTEVCPSDNVVTGKDMNGTELLWVLLETESGKKNICTSKGFNFDNVAPEAKLTLEWIQENEKDRLKVSVNTEDDISGINDKSAKIYISSEGENEREEKINLDNGSISIIIDGVNRECRSIISLSVNDNAGNNTRISKNTGRIYIFRNGKLERGEFAFSTDDGSGVSINDEGLLVLHVRSNGRVSSFAGILCDWSYGESTAYINIVQTRQYDFKGEHGGIYVTRELPIQGSNYSGTTQDILGPNPKIAGIFLGGVGSDWGNNRLVTFKIPDPGNVMWLGAMQCGAINANPGNTRNRDLEISNIYLDL